MQDCVDLNNLIQKIPLDKYEAFCSHLKSKISAQISLHTFKDKLFCDYISELSGEFFDNTLKSMLTLLNRKEVGIVALDVPEAPHYDKKENSVFGAAIVTGVFNHIGIANIDQINQTPFVIHTASHSNEQQIDSKGLENFTPEMKLGFHNDGLLSDQQIEIPHHIMVYNLFLGYKNPGNFIWIPTELWDESGKYEALAKNENITVKIKLSPNYHKDELGNIVNTISNYIEAPISCLNTAGQARFFLNGQVLVEDNLQKHVDFVQTIRTSLEKNNSKICIPQAERRAIYIKNTAGFHARNIFEHPFDGIDLTRVYLRAVDTKSELYFSNR